MMARAADLPCAHPIKMVDVETAEVIEVRCKSRRIAQCPSCAALYRGDASNILRVGALDSNADAFVWLTLGAPSFGDVHRVPRAPSKAMARKRKETKPRSCRCGVVHDEKRDDHLRGVPISPREYRYRDAVLWNRHVGALWHRTVDAIAEEWGERPEYVRVSEWQARGSVHFHCLIRVPAGVLAGASGPKTAESLAAAIEQICARVSTQDATGRTDIKWGGRSIHAEFIWDRHGDSKSTRVLCGYMAKLCNYAAKDLGDEVLVSDRSTQAGQHAARMAAEAGRLTCDHAVCRENRTVRAMGANHLVRPCPARSHGNFGYRGHTLTQSRRIICRITGSIIRAGWSGLTFRGLRETRRHFKARCSTQAEETGRTWLMFARLWRPEVASITKAAAGST